MGFSVPKLSEFQEMVTGPLNEFSPVEKLGINTQTEIQSFLSFIFLMYDVYTI